MGRTLAALWQRAQAFSIQDVVSGTPEGARAAVAFIGAGAAVARLEDMRAADVWMVATPDDRIAACATALAGTGALRAGDVVFHCSGALSSMELHPASMRGAHVASVHPVKSFADSRSAVVSFAGTWCAAEGDAAALSVLQPAFELIGARITRMEAASKLVYHAGSVMMSNYLVALVEVALRCHDAAGMSRDEARVMSAPLMRETLENVLRLGTVKALTGPVARGDVALVKQQLAALEKTDVRIAAIYRHLGAIAVELAREKGEASAAALDAIQRLVDQTPG